GYVVEDGSVIIEHMGGETLMSYEIHVTQSNHTYVYSYENTPWEIGDQLKPPIDIELFNEEGEISILVFCIFENNEREIIFDGCLNEDIRIQIPPSASISVLFSSLRSNTPDEDLLCFGENIAPELNPTSIIYTWLLKEGESFEPLAYLLMPFDTNSGVLVRDYAGNHNGSVVDASWIATGVSGGAYQFSGNQYILLPYCFPGSYIDDLSIEVWIKTSAASGTILSFGRDNYCELAVSDTTIKWSTNSSDGIADVKGTCMVSDGQWHQIVVTYAASTGIASIFIDGELDISEQVHGNGEVLGSGNSPSGLLGKGTGRADREILFATGFETLDEKYNWNQHNSTEEGGEETENLFTDSFEGNQWGNWNDGGYDCSMYSAGSYSYDGSYSIHLRDDNGWGSSAYTDMISADTNGYSQMTLDFWWIAVSMENGERFYVKYYDGLNNHLIRTITIGTGQYSNNHFYHTICYVNETDFTFTDQARFVIECDGNSDYDHIIFDMVYVNVTGSDRIDCDLDLRSSSILTPHSGTYSLGGTGDFDPEYAAFNRTGISLEGYSDVQITIWYSYINTEDSDFLGLYYLNDLNWTPLFEINNPDIGSGQMPWTNINADIPDEINELFLQFKWMTSSTSEYVAIDDLEITGKPIGGENNFTGILDEVCIYQRVISSEQIYQNYLGTLNCDSNLSIIVAEEIGLGDVWKCVLTPKTSTIDGVPSESNTISIVDYPGGIN
ncbi:MAG: hypothetical protein KKC68_08035, partial [Candidatus Thermoplasmatota archaeon]|nr:hypothetical protein [Candidatus Thermoplasmatota archaeon]